MSYNPLRDYLKAYPNQQQADKQPSWNYLRQSDLYEETEYEHQLILQDLIMLHETKEPEMVWGSF